MKAQPGSLSADFKDKNRLEAESPSSVATGIEEDERFFEELEREGQPARSITVALLLALAAIAAATGIAAVAWGLWLGWRV